MKWKNTKNLNLKLLPLMQRTLLPTATKETKKKAISSLPGSLGHKI